MVAGRRLASQIVPLEDSTPYTACTSRCKLHFVILRPFSMPLQATEGSNATKTRVEPPEGSMKRKKRCPASQGRGPVEDMNSTVLQPLVIVRPCASLCALRGKHEVGGIFPTGFTEHDTATLVLHPAKHACNAPRTCPKPDLFHLVIKTPLHRGQHCSLELLPWHQPASKALHIHC